MFIRIPPSAPTNIPEGLSWISLHVVLPLLRSSKINNQCSMSSLKSTGSLIFNCEFPFWLSDANGWWIYIHIPVFIYNSSECVVDFKIWIALWCLRYPSYIPKINKLLILRYEISKGFLEFILNKRGLTKSMINHSWHLLSFIFTQNQPLTLQLFI